MKTNKALDRLNKELAKKQENLAALTQKKAEIEKSISDAKSSIAETNEAIKQEKLNLLADAAGKQGTSVDDLLEMFLSGDSQTTATSNATADDTTLSEESGSDFSE